MLYDLYISRARLKVIIPVVITSHIAQCNKSSYLKSNLSSKRNYNTDRVMNDGWTKLKHLKAFEIFFFKSSSIDKIILFEILSSSILNTVKECALQHRLLKKCLTKHTL